MKAHILFLGGTGARIYRALIHCIASGMYHGVVPNDLEICAYMIDPDSDNGDGCRARNVANSYMGIRKKCMLDQKPLVDCPLFGIPLQNEMIPIPYIGNRDMDQWDDDTQLYLSALLGESNSKVKDETALYLALSSLDLSTIELALDPYRDIVMIVGGTFGTTGYVGLAQFAYRIRKLHSKCRVVMIPVGPYFKLQTPKSGRIHSDTFFVRHSLLNLFWHEALNRELSQISIYNVCMSDREVDALRYAEGGAEQRNPSHVVELCAAFTIFDLINKPWAEGKEFSFDMSGFKAGKIITLDDFPYDIRQQIDCLLCFSIWSRCFGKELSSNIKETNQFADDFQTWLEEMKQHTITFAPIDFSCDNLSKSFNWYKPMKEFGIFNADPLDSKNLQKLKKRDYQELKTTLSDGYRHLVSEYRACTKAWNRFRDLC